MTQNDKKKPGLQKEVSSIFKGVPIPEKRGPDEPSGSLASQLKGTAPGQPMSTAPQSPQTPQAPLGSPASQPAGNAPGQAMSAAPQSPQTPQAPPGSPASQPAGNDSGRPTAAPQSPQRPQATPGSPAQQPADNAPGQPMSAPQSPQNQRATVGSTAQQPTGNTPRKPVSAVHQSSQGSPVALIQKLNQPTELLRKGAPAKPLNAKPVVKAVGSGRLQRIKDRLFAPKPGSSSARQKASIALIPVLAIVLIFVIRQVFTTSPRKIEGAANDDAPSVNAAGDSENKVNWEIPAPYPATLRDPMKLGPAATEQTQAEESETTEVAELIIKGILYSDDNPTAVVGKRIVHVGEKVSGATVIRIDKDSVEFEMDGKRWKQEIPD